MKLIILAGGFGTRLKTVVADVPKALAPIGTVPFLQLQIEHWVKQGLRDFTFLLYHQADQIIEFLEQQRGGHLKDCQFNWLVEPKPMNTGGAVANAVKELCLDNDFLLTNADTWLGDGIPKMMKSTSPAMAAVSLPNVSRYGQVHFEKNHTVTAFTEKNPQATSGWINAGLSKLSPALFNEWDGQPFSLEQDLFFRLACNRKLIVIPLETDFIDIGVPDDFYRFCDWINTDRRLSL
jgi:NDP-sugar pyrophosphorylase family protein